MCFISDVVNFDIYYFEFKNLSTLIPKLLFFFVEKPISFTHSHTHTRAHTHTKMTKKGTSAASTDDVVMSVNERILRDCHNLYTDPKDGLITVARDVGIELLAPRKKINVLLIGNHSAGKSSFINWYVEGKITKNINLNIFQSLYI